MFNLENLKESVGLWSEIVAFPGHIHLLYAI